MNTTPATDEAHGPSDLCPGDIIRVSGQRGARFKVTEVRDGVVHCYGGTLWHEKFRVFRIEKVEAVKKGKADAGNSSLTRSLS